MGSVFGYQPIEMFADKLNRSDVLSLIVNNAQPTDVENANAPRIVMESGAVNQIIEGYAQGNAAARVLPKLCYFCFTKCSNAFE
jgi:hypothetical protein